jgi:hypothetical protein
MKTEIPILGIISQNGARYSVQYNEQKTKTGSKITGSKVGYEMELITQEIEKHGEFPVIDYRGCSFDAVLSFMWKANIPDRKEDVERYVELARTQTGAKILFK